MSGWTDVADHAGDAQAAGETVMYVAEDDKVVGYIGVQDKVRLASRDALRALSEFEPPVQRVMLTGDNPQAAERVAAEIGEIDRVRAGLLPDEHALRPILREGLAIMAGLWWDLGEGGP